jgi:hypothetical protein
MPIIEQNRIIDHSEGWIAFSFLRDAREGMTDEFLTRLGYLPIQIVGGESASGSRVGTC